MNKQRKVLITTTYNEMGIIIDTKAEEVAQPLNQDSIETQSSDLISRQAALELCDWYDNPSMREDLEKLRPARFSTDTISRQAAIETVMECYDNAELFEVYEEKLRELPPAQPEKRTDKRTETHACDLIDRQAAIEKILGQQPEAHYPQWYARQIEQLPPAQPESDSGRWERHYSRPGVYADLYWHCSKCGYKTDYQYANVNHHYCPHCGRKMEREVSNE